jgi:hypothetical protein
MDITYWKLVPSDMRLQLEDGISDPLEECIQTEMPTTPVTLVKVEESQLTSCGPARAAMSRTRSRNA